MSLMKQMSLATAGCQRWNANVLAVKDSRFAYASTLTVYIYKPCDRGVGHGRSFTLYAVLCAHQLTITCLDWHPTNPDLIASSSFDPLLALWSIERQQVLVALRKSSLVPQFFCWYPPEDNTIMYLSAHGPPRLWKYETDPQELNHVLKNISTFKSYVSQVAWNSDRVAFGHLDGTLSIYFKTSPSRSKYHLILKTTRENEVNKHTIISLQWDKLSPNYLLVLPKSNNLYLVDTETDPPRVAMTYTSQSSKISFRSSLWLPGNPGTFLTADAELGILRFWNVSKPTPLESLKVKDSGFLAFAAVTLSVPKWKQSIEEAARLCLACTFVDGGVGVYNLRRRNWTFLCDMGHVETVFDCAFKPENPNLLATCSYDGKIKVWNICKMVPEITSVGNESVIYSLSWAPLGLNSLAAATSRNGVIIWQVGGLVSKRLMSHGQAAVFAVAWNQLEPRLIASGGGDSMCKFHQALEGVLVHSVAHPGKVYDCKWHPKERDLIASACQDKAIRIFRVTLTFAELQVVLWGHADSVFHVRWSPLQSDILCSGSDDMTIRVWDVQREECLSILTGHKDKIRALAWHPELPNVILSGGWDAQLRFWDGMAAKCLDVILDHGADVYGLAFHPQQPFVFATTSRDCTVRLWSVQSVIYSLHVQILLGYSLSTILLPEDSDPRETLYLGGIESRALKEVLAKPDVDTIERYRLISNFFCPVAGGMENLWYLLRMMTESGAKGDSFVLPPSSNDVLHGSQMRPFLLSEASRFLRSCQTSRDTLKQAAFYFLLQGDTERYCETKMELGEWEDALSVAPSVSLSYWRRLAVRRARQLTQQEDSKAIALHVATRNREGLVQFFRQCGHLNWAHTAAISAFWPGGDKGAHRENESSAIMAEFTDPLVIETVKNRAESFLKSGQVFQAACCWISINNLEEALEMMLRGNELEILYSVALALDRKNSMQLTTALTYLAWRCTLDEQFELALDLLSINPHQKLAQICICAYAAENDRIWMLDKMGLISPTELLDKAKALETQDPPPIKEIVMYYLLSSCPILGVRMGLRFLQRCFQQGDWTLNRVWDVMLLLQSTNSKTLKSDKDFCLLVQGYSAYLGGIMAIQKFYHPIVPFLYQHAASMLSQVSVTEAILRVDDLLQEMKAWDMSRTEGAKLSGEQAYVLERLTRRLDLSNAVADVGETHVTGSQLPHHSDRRRCFFTNGPLTGPIFPLNEASAVSLNVALMWAKVNPFSPLGNGERIFPF